MGNRLLTAVCEYEVAKYPDDQMAAAQAEAFLQRAHLLFRLIESKAKRS